ncbi:carboxylating nicotinate-nucleotide diphosphorylase [Paenibacillus thermotolerans]|uniref:carboxylating nicotinate-nucleotide diphosphorylase n=1 Tax=Paenibacillus thermotolerans TaxID=3027807 RepID=UPI002368B375|nr:MULTISPECIES: carboxylating nicotinate-nucleotide diphosphorylase [unclassified Paenibacillus]
MNNSGVMIDWESLRERVREWLREDVGPGDVTTLSTIPEAHRSRAVIHAKADGVAAGLPVAKLIFDEVDPKLIVSFKSEEGARISKGDILIEVEGGTRSILTGERLALNLLQRLSGIATKTYSYVRLLDGLPNAPRIVDTRKTTPGLRLLEKYAVRVGGGHNHRFGLFDAVLLKDNHLKAAGGVAAAVKASRANIPHTMKIEVEVESLEQAREAIEAGADIIMLDNMSTEAMKEAVAIIRANAPRTVIEASGGVSHETLRGIAETGVDVISVGGLTHSVQALDISLDLFDKKEVRG